MGAILDRLCRAGEAVAIASLLAATGLILVQIVGREFFNAGLPWADELARFAGLAMVFLVVPVLLQHGMHVRVDYFLGKLGPRAQKRVELANEIATLAFCVLFVWAAYWFMQRAGRFSTPAVGIPNLVYYLPAMLGMALTLLVAIRRVARALKP